jgi:hypothetical protein
MSILQASSCFLEDISRATKARSTNMDGKKDYIAYIPYIHGTTDRISRLLKKKDIHTVQKPSHLESAEDRQLLTQKSGIYKMQQGVHQPNGSPRIHQDFVIHIGDAILEN